MRTQCLFLALVVCLLLGVTVSSGQIRAQVPGSSDPEREDRELWSDPGSGSGC